MRVGASMSPVAVAAHKPPMVTAPATTNVAPVIPIMRTQSRVVEVVMIFLVLLII
jgi:hypothetical protein